MPEKELAPVYSDKIRRAREDLASRLLEAANGSMTLPEGGLDDDLTTQVIAAALDTRQAAVEGDGYATKTIHAMHMYYIGGASLVAASRSAGLGTDAMGTGVLFRHQTIELGAEEHRGTVTEALRTVLHASGAPNSDGSGDGVGAGADADQGDGGNVCASGIDGEAAGNPPSPDDGEPITPEADDDADEHDEDDDEATDATEDSVDEEDAEPEGADDSTPDDHDEVIENTGVRFGDVVLSDDLNAAIGNLVSALGPDVSDQSTLRAVFNRRGAAVVDVAFFDQHIRPIVVGMFEDPRFHPLIEDIRNDPLGDCLLGFVGLTTAVDDDQQWHFEKTDPLSIAVFENWATGHGFIDEGAKEDAEELLSEVLDILAHCARAMQPDESVESAEPV